jgi:EAL domain-containing protein (putative c-di-GMP-specific phosphodiesterase class I)
MINWNFDYVIPSLLMLSVLMGFYYALPRLPIRMNKLFLAILVNEAIVILFDIISSWADNNYQVISTPILILLNSVFFISFAARMYLYYCFTAALLRVDTYAKRIHTIIVALPIIFLQLLVLIGFVQGTIFYIDDTGYHRGPFHSLIYVVSFFYVIYSFIIMFRLRDRIRRKRERYGIFFFNFIIFVGLIFRYSLPKVLLFDTFCMMSDMVIYLVFANPEGFLERRSYTFNSKALRSYVEENLGKRGFKMLAFVLNDYHDMREIYGGVQMDQGIALISAHLIKCYPKCVNFYYNNGRFIILGDNKTEFEVIHEELRNRFKLPWRAFNAELYLDACYALLDCNKVYRSVDEVFNTLNLLLDKTESLGDDYNILSDEGTLQDYEDRLDVKKALEYAVDNDKVEVFLQPLLNSATRKVIGAEALSRIRDADGKIISPGAFIPIAEMNGRINQLGEQVFEKVCRFISENDIETMGLEFINVNLSPIQFMRSDLVDRFTSIINKYDVNPELIHLEITEVFMIDELQMERQINILQRSGFKFVLDDYGKGYSNLSRMKRSPFVNIKLDMEVVWDYCNEPDVFIPMMVKAFKEMDLGITAEGIETEQMADAMTDIGVDYLQGMLFSPPIPEDEFVKKYSSK